MKGFASRIDRGKVFCWLYRKGSEPKEVNTRNIGVENSFYESEDGLTADGHITEAERPFADLVNTLRGQPNGFRVDDPRLGGFVAHLVVRTKSLREGFQDVVAKGADHLNEHFSILPNLFRIILQQPKLIEEQIAERLDSLNLNVEGRGRIEGMMREMLPGMLQELTENPGPEFHAFVSDFFALFRQQIPQIVQKSQIESLVKDVSPEPRAENYRRLNWWIMIASAPLILGDIGVLFDTTGPRRFKFIDDSDDQLSAVYIPISSDRLLVGTHSKTAPGVDVQDLNRAMAHNSQSYFVACCDSQDLAHLLPEIGKENCLLTEESVRAKIGEVILELENAHDTHDSQAK